ncbi:MAG: DUF1330 domain-containing protein [Pseudomonadota bacterium]
MPAFMIIAARIHDREAFVAGYGAEAAKLVHKYGGRYLVVAPGASLLEGTLDGYTSVAVSEWPTREAALDFWNSDEYADVKRLRDGLADVEVLLVDAPAEAAS